MKIAVPVFFLGLAGSNPSLAQESTAYLGAADCKIGTVRPAPEGELSWSGKCQDGYAQGQGVLEWTPNKSKKHRLEGTLEHGVIQGEATLTMPNGTVYIGTFKNGIGDGKGYFRFPDGMQYEGEVRNGKREGSGEGVFANGNHYWGQWKDGKLEGTGRMQYIMGGQYEGEWKAGKRHGKGTLTYAGSGRQYAGRFVDGLIEGAPPPPRPSEKFTLKSEDPLTGSHINYDVARASELPVNLDYKALTPTQKALFHSYYPALEEGDEPPYPLYGPQEFYKFMAKLTGHFRARGDLRIYVLVGPNGRAESVTMIGLKDEEVRRAAGTGAGLLQYKPALCRGKPCSMIYGFNFRLETEL